MEARPSSSTFFRSTNTYAELSDFLRDLPKAANAATVAEILAECATPGDTLVVGVTGSVAAGKTTFCAAVANQLRPTMRVEVASTDGFLLPNETLVERGLMLRKGFPETYDTNLLAGVLQRVRWGPVSIPGYSHVTYNRASDLDRTINRPDILLVEGLGLSPSGKPRAPSALLDLLIYIDASETDLESWFVSRFMTFWREAENNASSFYVRFRSMPEADAEAFARQVWANINLPNLREHIAPARLQADVLIRKASDHGMNLSMPAFRGDA